LNGSGTGTYNWSPSATLSCITCVSPVANPTVTTTYTLDVTNSCGTASDSILVTINALLSVSASSTNVSCFGMCDGSVTANPTGGLSPYSYLWNPGGITSQSILNLCSGTYTVTITDASGCNTNSTAIVTQPAMFSATATSSAVSCNAFCNGTATATPSGGTSPYTYSWNNGQISQTVAALCPDSYTVAITDNNGCNTSNTVSVSATLPIPITVTTTPTTCGSLNGTATANISGGGAVPPFNVLWNTGDTSMSISGRAAGIYRVNVKDGNGCFSFADALITNSNGPVVATNLVTDVSCFGLSNGAIDINITGSSPFTFSWSNGSTTEDISGLAYGPYEVVVSDASACSATKSVFVNQPFAPLSATTSAVNSSCPGANGSTSVSVSGGTAPYTYYWSSGVSAATASGLASGTYSITVTDSSGCSLSDMAAVSDSAGPVVITDTISAVDCGSTGLLVLNPQNASSIQSYQWNTGSTAQNLSGVTPGNYGVVITDTNGCKSALVVPVKPALPPLKPICLLTVDSLTQQNFMAWEKPLSSFISGFNIYRESSQNGLFQHVGFVPFSSPSSFYDSVSNPNDRWAKYRISMTDVCGMEGPLSLEHKTIHLAVLSPNLTTKTLVWDEYVGYTFTNYHIFRKNSSAAAWMLIDSVPAAVTSYSDTTFTFGDTLYYNVEVSFSGGCSNLSLKTPQPMKSNLNSSRSNIYRVGQDPTPVINTDVDKVTLVYPNPSNGLFTIDMTNNVSGYASLKVFNMLGEEVYEAPSLKGDRQTINLSKQPQGVYYLQISTSEKIITKKIVVE
ncbi:MAG: T9SS type A sorting domain-containing protein, partial [Bacteroidetes bacterium]|nr:T9SS type A sorting domain-containing protein [Bacteroidota bacterium]